MARSIRESRLGQPLGQSLWGKTVLVVGLGGIAKEVRGALLLCHASSAVPCFVCTQDWRVM